MLKQPVKNLSFSLEKWVVHFFPIKAQWYLWEEYNFCNDNTNKCNNFDWKERRLGEGSKQLKWGKNIRKNSYQFSLSYWCQPFSWHTTSCWIQLGLLINKQVIFEYQHPLFLLIAAVRADGKETDCVTGSSKVTSATWIFQVTVQSTFPTQVCCI